MVVRELTGGIYFGDKQRTADRGVATSAATPRRRSSAWCALAAQLARARRRKLTSVDKANVLETSRLWRAVVERIVPSEFPDVSFEHMLVDSAAMHLIRRPRDFDVIVTENMFGDILTDEASMLAGSMGLLPSASLGAEATRRALRAHPRLGARHRRPGHRQSLRDDPERGHAAALFARARRRRRDCLEAAVSKAIDVGRAARRSRRAGRRVRSRRVPPEMRFWLRCSDLRCGALETGGEVGEQVLGILDADRQPQQAVGPMPGARRAASSMPACVMLAGCAIRLSTPPSDSASVKHSSPARNAATAGSPPASSKLSMAPKPLCWRRAISCPDASAEPGIVDLPHGRMPLQPARRPPRRSPRARACARAACAARAASESCRTARR